MAHLLPEFIFFHQHLDEHAEDILSGRLKAFGSMPTQFNQLRQSMMQAFPLVHDLVEPQVSVPELFRRMQLFMTKSRWVHLLKESGLIPFFNATRAMYLEYMEEAGILPPASRVRRANQS